MRALLFTLVLFTLVLFTPSALAQDLWLESGVAYAEAAPQQYDAGFKLGLRALLPVSETASLFIHPAIGGGFNLEGGVLVRFPLGASDPEYLRAHLGGSAGLVRGRLALGVVGALSYELAPQAELALVYSHRALLTPQLGQAFDVALALILRFD